MLTVQPLHEMGQPAARNAIRVRCPQKRVVVRHTCLPVVFVDSLRIIMQTNSSENGMADELGSVLMNLVFQLGELLVCFQDSILEILIDIGRIFAGSLSLIA